MAAVEKYCAATKSDAAAALAAAAAAGLESVPPEAVAGLPVDHPQGRFLAPSGPMMAVGVTDSPRRVPGFEMHACVVSGVRGPGSQTAALRRWIGVPLYERTRLEDGNLDEVYFFDENDAGRRTLDGASDSQLLELAAQGRVRVALLMQDAEFTAIVYGVLKPVAPPPAEVTAAAAPAAQDPFADFQTLCLAHRGKPEESSASAAAAGWMRAPKSLVGDRLPAPMVAGDVHVRSTESDFELFAAGRGQMQIGQQYVSFSLCGIFQAPPNDRSLLARVNSWVGVEPVDTYPDGSRVYLFTEAGDARRTLAGPRQEQALARGYRGGAVSIVVTQQGSSMNAPAVAIYGVVDRVSLSSVDAPARAAR